MLLSVTDNRQSRTTSYTYDANYRTDSVTTPEGTLNYHYDDNDRLTSYQIDSGPLVSYGYYDDGSVKQISRDGKNIYYTYLRSGQKEYVRYPFASTAAIKYTYDTQGRLTQIQNYKLAGLGTITTLSSYAYTYDFDHPEYPEEPDEIWKGYRTRMDEYVST